MDVSYIMDTFLYWINEIHTRTIPENYYTVVFCVALIYTIINFWTELPAKWAFVSTLVGVLLRFYLSVWIILLFPMLSSFPSPPLFFFFFNLIFFFKLLFLFFFF